jgi:hypothetical protein
VGGRIGTICKTGQGMNAYLIRFGGDLRQRSG